VAVRYVDCEAATNSNPEFKACLARAADKADQKLNQAAAGQDPRGRQ
jgi:hypothetical protein